MADLGQAYVQIVPSAQGISGKIASVLNPEAKSAGQSAGQSIGSNIGSFAVKAVAALGVGKAISNSISNGMDFESSMAKASTLFSGTSEEFAALQNQILDISSSTGMAASQLAEAAYSAESASVPMENLGSMIEASSKLAVAGFTDVDTALSATAKTMNAYGMMSDNVAETQANMEKVQRILIQTQNKGITTVGELGASLAQVTPTAAGFGVSFEQVGAALAGMTAQGTPTAQATTQLNALLSELGKEGGNASKILQEKTGQSFTSLMNAGYDLNDVLGFMTKDMEGFGDLGEKVTKALDEQEGSVKDWGAAFDQALEEVPEAKQNLIDMFGSIEAGKAALSLTNSDWAGNMEAMATEADVVGEAFGTMSDTVKFKMDQLKTTLQNMGIEAFSAVADEIGNALSTISTVFSEIQPELGELGSAFLDAAGSAVDFVADLLGIEEGSSTTETVIAVLKEVLGGLADALKFVSENMEIVAPVAATLAGGLMLMKSPIPGIVSSMGGLVEKLGSLGSAASNAASPVSTAAPAFGTMAGEALKMVAAAAALFIAAEAINVLVDAAIRITSAGGAAIAVLAGMAVGIGALMAVASAVGPGLTAGAVGIGVFGAAMLAIGGGIDLACQGISTLVDSVSGLVDTISSNADSINTIIDQVGTSFGGVVTTISEGVATVVDSIGGAISGVLDSVSGIIDSIGNAALNAGTGFETLANAVLNLTNNTGVLDLGATLTAVSTGVKQISSAASQASSGATGVKTLTTAFSALDTGVKTSSATMQQFSATATAGAGQVASAFASMNLAGVMASQMSGALSQTYAGIGSIQSAMLNAYLRLGTSVVVPHFSLSGTFDAQAGTVPTVVTSWYAKAAELGAIFSSPTIIGVGDAAQPEVLLGENKLRELTGADRPMEVNNYITVNGAQDPEAWAMKFARQIKLELRMT